MNTFFLFGYSGTWEMWEEQLPVKTDTKKLLTASVFSMTVTTRFPVLFITRGDAKSAESCRSPWRSDIWCYQKIQHRAVSFSRTHVSWCREEFNAELEVVQWLFLKLGSIWTYSQISPSHDKNVYIVEYMEEGDFLVLLCGKDTLKSHYTQLFQCRISYYYVAPRVDAPGKMWNNELQIQMAATMDSMVRLSEVSPPQPCNPLPEGLKLHIWHWHCAVGRISCTVLLPGEAHGSK